MDDILNVPLPSDDAPNIQILRQTIYINLLRALEHTVFTCEVLVQQDGTVARNVIANCTVTR